MDYAIAELTIALDIAERNAAIHDDENKREQARRERERAESFRRAINRLKAAYVAPECKWVLNGDNSSGGPPSGYIS